MKGVLGIIKTYLFLVLFGIAVFIRLAIAMVAEICNELRRSR